MLHQSRLQAGVLMCNGRQRERSLTAGAWRCAGTMSAFFRGNGTNVIKIAPETAIKLSCNDRLKRMVCEDVEDITPAQRMLSGALAGAVAQVSRDSAWNSSPRICTGMISRGTGRAGGGHGTRNVLLLAES